ncbi:MULTISPECIES: hypothetical protein [Aneurinibacillus]|uniref:Uncharacterized protein n=1 Tax=Aneurinibacillus thermoaerophilus TaxID=143495 RepID=A0A1G7Y599_ANETH|nr:MULTISPECIES: hypothetical protein [Aneurinibacillus]AMA72865.1 hypothetical protein ACH33_08365 [Aneurinibacillus sp. XH2]MED0677647.1 hypothetical protein [Aneurinibacillus thermoaerophilus]MED0737616.1 hypothetical protein [Aneurinibacillus thermoaerophilus]MED0758188.1 hypothetical protein [Aneurinibacillus thermoaerophilus]MED0761342.1 hypothetical protein [Aneurinibacillus thermoaerophilus]
MWSWIKKIFSLFGKKKQEDEQTEELAEPLTNDKKEENESQTLTDMEHKSGVVVYRKRLPKVPGRKKARKTPVHVIDKELLKLLDHRNDLSVESVSLSGSYSPKIPLRTHQIQLYNALKYIL